MLPRDGAMQRWARLVSGVGRSSGLCNSATATTTCALSLCSASTHLPAAISKGVPRVAFAHRTRVRVAFVVHERTSMVVLRRAIHSM